MKFEAILFDCDGVLVDSEPITNGVLCAMLNEAGWALSSEECMRIFIGKTVRSEAARIEAHTGQPLTDAWMAAFYARRNARLETELQAIEGAVEAVRAVHARLGGRIACASGADRFKVEMQLDKVGLAPYFAGRRLGGCRGRGGRRHRGGLQPLARGPWHARGAARRRGRAGDGAHGRIARSAGLSRAMRGAAQNDSQRVSSAVAVAGKAAAGLRGALAGRGILVRVFDEPTALRFGLPAGEDEWQRLSRALKEVS